MDPTMKRRLEAALNSLDRQESGRKFLLVEELGVRPQWACHGLFALYAPGDHECPASRYKIIIVLGGATEDQIIAVEETVRRDAVVVEGVGYEELAEIFVPFLEQWDNPVAPAVVSEVPAVPREPQGGPVDAEQGESGGEPDKGESPSRGADAPGREEEVMSDVAAAPRGATTSTGAARPGRLKEVVLREWPKQPGGTTVAQAARNMASAVTAAGLSSDHNSVVMAIERHCLGKKSGRKKASAQSAKPAAPVKSPPAKATRPAKKSAKMTRREAAQPRSSENGTGHAGDAAIEMLIDELLPEIRAALHKRIAGALAAKDQEIDRLKGRIDRIEQAMRD